MHIRLSHLLHSGITGPGHAVTRMTKRRDRALRPIRPSHKNELWYRAELHRLIKHMRARVQQAVMPVLESLWPRQVTDGARVAVDSPTEASAKAAIKNLAREFGGIDKLAKRIAYGAAARSRDTVDERLAAAIRRSVSIDVKPFLVSNPRIAKATHAAIESNVDLIKTIPEEYFAKITDAVEMNWAGGMRWESLVERVQEIGDITERRAALIARDQTAKMNSSFNRIRQTDLGIEEYEWQTSGDERVRGNPAGKYPDAESDHWDLDGKIFRWDEPGPCKGTIDGAPCHPGEDILDRCNAIPHINIDAMEAELGFREAA